MFLLICTYVCWCFFLCFKMCFRCSRAVMCLVCNLPLSSQTRFFLLISLLQNILRNRVDCWMRITVALRLIGRGRCESQDPPCMCCNHPRISLAIYMLPAFISDETRRSYYYELSLELDPLEIKSLFAKWEPGGKETFSWSSETENKNYAVGSRERKWCRTKRIKHHVCTFYSFLFKSVFMKKEMRSA